MITKLMSNCTMVKAHIQKVNTEIENKFNLVMSEFGG